MLLHFSSLGEQLRVSWAILVNDWFSSDVHEWGVDRKEGEGASASVQTAPGDTLHAEWIVHAMRAWNVG